MLSNKDKLFILNDKIESLKQIYLSMQNYIENSNGLNQEDNEKKLNYVKIINDIPSKITVLEEEINKIKGE